MFKIQQWQVMVLGSFALGVFGLSGCGEKKVIATVNNQPILREEFVNQLEARYGMQILQSLILKQLVDQECKREGILLSDAEVLDGLAEWKQAQGLRNDEAFVAYLGSHGLTEKDIREDVRVGIEIEKLATKDVKVTEAEMKKFFDEHHQQFDRPETVTLAQLVCQDKATADKVRQQLVNGAAMNEMVAQYSIDQASKANGGIMREVAVESLGSMASTIKKIPIAGYSDPLPTASGYVIVKVISRSAAKPATYEQVKKQLERGLKSRKGKPQDKVLQDLLKKANLVIEVPRYLQLKDMLTPGAGRGTSPTQPGPPASKGKAARKAK